MERKNAWKDYSEKELSELAKLNEGYIDFISECKTERLCAKRAIELAEKAGYVSLEKARKKGLRLKAGDKIWADIYGKSIACSDWQRTSLWRVQYLRCDHRLAAS